MSDHAPCLEKVWSASETYEVPIDSLIVHVSEILLLLVYAWSQSETGFATKAVLEGTPSVVRDYCARKTNFRDVIQFSPQLKLCAPAERVQKIARFRAPKETRHQQGRIPRGRFRSEIA